MKAFVLAAGLGTRLKPWTLTHPKALVTVGGVPMLERVIRRLEQQGFDSIVVNVHHFGEQIIDFLASRTWSAQIRISDERARLLDTGGALLHAAPLLCQDDEPFLVHNVDILSDAPFDALMDAHRRVGAEATLLVSERESSRHLCFDSEMNLHAWLNNVTGERRGEPGSWPVERAFSGIHVISPSLLHRMEAEDLPEVFPIMDFYLDHTRTSIIKGWQTARDLHILDIGKPRTLEDANKLFGSE